MLKTKMNEIFTIIFTNKRIILIKTILKTSRERLCILSLRDKYDICSISNNQLPLLSLVLSIISYDGVLRNVVIITTEGWNNNQLLILKNPGFKDVSLWNREKKKE